MDGYIRAIAGAAAVVAIAALLVIPRLQSNGVGGPASVPRPAVSPAVSPSTVSPVASSASPSTASPSPGASTSTDTKTWSAFTSTRDGYSIKYPAAWTATAAIVPWTFASLSGGSTSPTDASGSPAVDQFDGPGGIGFVVSSQKIPPGMSDAQWFEAYNPTYVANGCFPRRPAWAPINVAGKAGGVHGGLPECGFTEAVVIDGGRAYVLTGYVNVSAPQNPPGIFDRSLFDAFLSTVHFSPGTADDRPPVRPIPS